MKKTLILICSLAAATVAQAAVTVPLTFTTGFEAKAPVTTLNGADISTTLSTEVANTDTLGSGAISDNGAYYVPEENVGNGGSWTMTFSYTLPEYVESLSISSIDLSAVMCTSGGVAHWDSKGRGVTFTVSINGTAVGTSTWTTSSGASAPFDTPTITLANALTLTDDFTLAIKAERTQANGAFFGLNEVSLSGTANVPEPATATLSLLALAGLAARRRRK